MNQNPPEDKVISLRDLAPTAIPASINSNADMLETLSAIINTLNHLEGDIAQAAPQEAITEQIANIRWVLTVLTHQFQFRSGLLDSDEPYQELLALIEEHAGILYQPGWYSCQQDLIARLRGEA